MKPTQPHQTQILVKIRGRGKNRTGVHLYNPHPRYLGCGSGKYPASVCPLAVGPERQTANGHHAWEVRDGSIADVTCKKCHDWADSIARRMFLPFVALLLDIPSVVPSEREHWARREKRKRVFAQWDAFTGRPHPSAEVVE